MIKQSCRVWSSKSTQSYMQVITTQFVVLNGKLFVPQLDYMDVEKMWFQPDCTRCNTPLQAIALQRETFDQRVVAATAH